MISLVCTKCSAQLTVDDGFAGGVCRCSHCGTIQTVPGRGAGNSGKSIFERQSRGGDSSRELEALSEAVTSSGLSGSGIFHATRTVKKKPPRTTLPIVWLVAGGVLVVLGVVLGAWLTSGKPLEADPTNRVIHPSAPGNPGDPAGSVNHSPADANAAKPVVGPAYLNMSLGGGRRVIYLIDRGESTRNALPGLAEVTARSIQSLEPGAVFQVRFWTAGEQTPTLPQQFSRADPANIAKVREGWSAVEPARTTDAIVSLRSAIAQQPDVIVLVTGKGWQLDDEFLAAARKMLVGQSVRVFGVSIDADASDALTTLIREQAGRLITVPAADLE